MNIVFWSPLSGHGATTSNMACLSIMSSLLHCYKTIAFQTGYSCNNLDQTFIKDAGRNADTVNEEFAYYVGRGIDGILGSIFLDSFTKESIKDYCIETVKGFGYYIPSTTRSSEELYNEKLQLKLDKLLQLCKQSYDLTFIDNQSKVDSISNKVFENADICVINLSQNPEIIHYTKQQYEKIIKRCGTRCKILYVIGRYDENSGYSAKAIAKTFKIPLSDIGVVPYSSNFLQAVMTGKTHEFLYDNLKCHKKNEDYYFMCEVKRITEKLLMKAGEISD